MCPRISGYLELPKSPVNTGLQGLHDTKLSWRATRVKYHHIAIL